MTERLLARLYGLGKRRAGQRIQSALVGVQAHQVAAPDRVMARVVARGRRLDVQRVRHGRALGNEEVKPPAVSEAAGRRTDRNALLPAHLGTMVRVPVLDATYPDRPGAVLERRDIGRPERAVTAGKTDIGREKTALALGGPEGLFPLVHGLAPVGRLAGTIEIDGNICHERSLSRWKPPRRQRPLRASPTRSCFQAQVRPAIGSQRQPSYTAP